MDEVTLLFIVTLSAGLQGQGYSFSLLSLFPGDNRLGSVPTVVDTLRMSSRSPRAGITPFTACARIRHEPGSRGLGAVKHF